MLSTELLEFKISGFHQTLLLPNRCLCSHWSLHDLWVRKEWLLIVGDDDVVIVWSHCGCCPIIEIQFTRCAHVVGFIPICLTLRTKLVWNGIFWTFNQICILWRIICSLSLLSTNPLPRITSTEQSKLLCIRLNSLCAPRSSSLSGSGSSCSLFLRFRIMHGLDLLHGWVLTWSYYLWWVISVLDQKLVSVPSKWSSWSACFGFGSGTD